MSYLNRDERREVILQAAMRVALAEGFAAMTVRRIASEADVAAGQVHHHFKLWREAQILADRDPHIRDAYLLTMQMWHEETVTIIEQGKQAGEFTFTANATDIAWRLIALVCGLDGMYVLGIPEMADPAFKYHLDRMITLELFA